MPLYTTIGVIAKKNDPKIRPTLERVCASLATHGVNVLVDTDASTPLPASVQKADRKRIVSECDLALVIGGDGTLLAAGRSLAPTSTPILGINQGRLGFLTDVNPDDIDVVLDEVFNGQTTVDERLTLHAQPLDKPKSKPALAVNDIVLRSLTTIRMLEFETWLETDAGEWEFISRHRADGLIVSTPTGSTAYAMSGGGPVLHPDLQAVALVPICPHTLSDRPIAVPAQRRIRITFQGAKTGGATFTCDGQTTIALDGGSGIEISRAPHPLRLIHTHRYSYFRVLRDKLRWGQGQESLVIERA